MNFHKSAKKVVEAAMSYAIDKKHEFLTPEHMLMAILESHAGIYENIDISVVVKTLIDFLDKNMTTSKKKPMESAAFGTMISNAVTCATNAGKDEVDVGDLLAGIWNTKCQANAILRAYKISRGDTVSAAQKLKEGKDVEDKGYLGTFCVEMVQAARDGKYDPVIGRDEEIERTIEVLCRKKKNDPLHRGEPGVGKSSLVMGLAQRIANGDVPDMLKGYEVWSVDLGGMLAGCKYRGEFEQRVDGVIKEAIKKPRCVLYIDEIHNLVGAGNGGGGALDAANMFRPYLSSGELRVIGSTTFEDYKHSIEKDGALARRFQNIDVLAPSEKETVEILKGLKANYEKYHNVEYPDETLTLAAHLANAYVKERRLPDSAIDVIDEAGARAKVRNFKEGENNDVIVITEEMIETIVSRMAKLPTKTVSKDDGARLQRLEEDLKREVFGQDEAIDKLVVSIKRSRAGFRKKKKPIANLIFAGKSGTGKSHLAQECADLLGVKLIRWDMSELSEKNSVSKWIGSAAGYIGYEEGGQLVDQISKNPNCVLLLDEIEKASPDVFNLMLGIMDNAELTDSHGKTADFSSVLIIMTSNVGASRVGERNIGFDRSTVGKTNLEAITQEYEKTFTPEFRNRVDSLVIFNDLTNGELRKIVGRELEEFQETLDEKGIKLTLTDAAIDFLVKNGYDDKLGARPLVRLFEREVKDRLIDVVLFGSLKEGGNATMDLDGEHLKVITEDHIVTAEKTVTEVTV